jgi:ABC-2 type transport system permease protein
VINAVLAGMLWGSEGIDWEDATALYTLFSGMFPTIAVIIILQDAIVGEKESGTAAWVLSKPVSRSAFILAKLIAHTSGVLVTMVLFPGIVAFLQLSLAGGQLSPFNFLLGMGVLGLNMLFYLTLTLMLGTLFDHRAAVIGIPLALAFGQQMILGLAPFLVQVLPWIMIVPFGEIELPIAAALIRGRPPPTLTPLYSISISIVIFIAVSLWRFEKEEL